MFEGRPRADAIHSQAEQDKQSNSPQRPKGYIITTSDGQQHTVSLQEYVDHLIMYSDCDAVTIELRPAHENNKPSDGVQVQFVLQSIDAEPQSFLATALDGVDKITEQDSEGISEAQGDKGDAWGAKPKGDAADVTHSGCELRSLSALRFHFGDDDISVADWAVAVSLPSQNGKKQRGQVRVRFIFTILIDATTR